MLLYIFCFLIDYDKPQISFYYSKYLIEGLLQKGLIRLWIVYEVILNLLIKKLGEHMNNNLMALLYILYYLLTIY